MAQKNRMPVFAALLFIFCRISFAQSERSTVFNICATAQSKDSILLTWEFDQNLEKNAEYFELYRANKPFAMTYELSSTARIASLPPDRRTFLDKVYDYREYYYAVIVKTSDGEDRIILPSINATVNGIHRKTPEIKKQTIDSPSAKEKIYPEGTLREIPLPTLDMLQAEKKVLPMKEQTLKAGEKLAFTKTDASAEKIILEPYAFEEDLISPESGEDYLLFETLHSTFAKKKYTEGTEKLKEFLSINHSKNITDRAIFYLGECQYFSGNFKDAIMSFLKVQDVFPELSQKWIDSSLDLISIPDIPD